MMISSRESFQNDSVAKSVWTRRKKNSIKVQPTCKQYFIYNSFFALHILNENKIYTKNK